MKIQKPNQMVRASILFLLLASLACSFPSFLGGNTKLVSEIEEDLQTNTHVKLREVVITQDIIKVAIDLPGGESQFAQFASWIDIYSLVLQHVPDVELVRIDTYILDEPCIAVSAQAENITALVNQEIEPLEFSKRLLVEDQGSPALKINQALGNLGWMVADIQLTTSSIDIEGFPPEADTYEDIVSIWLEALSLAAEHAPDSDQINLHLLFVGQPRTTLSVSRPDLMAYENGELDVVSFLANVSISE